MFRVDGDGIFCAIRGVTRSLQLRKTKGSSSIHQLHALVICKPTTTLDDLRAELIIDC